MNANVEDTLIINTLKSQMWENMKGSEFHIVANARDHQTVHLNCENCGGVSFSTCQQRFCFSRCGLLASGSAFLVIRVHRSYHCGPVWPRGFWKLIILSFVSLNTQLADYY